MPAHATPQPTQAANFRYMIFQTPQTQRMSAELILVETLYGGSPSPEDMHILEWVQMPAHATLQPTQAANFRYMIFQTPQTQRMSAELTMVKTPRMRFLSPEDMHILEWVQMPAHATLQPIPVVSFKYMISLASISPPALCTHSKQAVCKSVITLSLITC